MLGGDLGYNASCKSSSLSSARSETLAGAVRFKSSGCILAPEGWPWNSFQIECCLSLLFLSWR